MKPNSLKQVTYKIQGHTALDEPVLLHIAPQVILHALYIAC